MKAIYKFDDNKTFVRSETVDDDYQATANETEVKPEDGLYEPLTWSGTTWVGTDKEVWQAAQEAKQAELLKTHPELAPQPTVEQKQLAELIKSNAQQMALNAQLIKQVAALRTAQATQTAQAAQAEQAAQTQTTQEAK
ncbi:hypothetical protein AB0Y04_02760 [Loigolactobacillus coryniformis]|uniref:hypothetical protein n=1 Tax=Loigolactobacillus coryniformis TaxID=1610 RepID=UPI003F200426